MSVYASYKRTRGVEDERFLADVASLMSRASAEVDNLGGTARLRVRTEWKAMQSTFLNQVVAVVAEVGGKYQLRPMAARNPTRCPSNPDSHSIGNSPM